MFEVAYPTNQKNHNVDKKIIHTLRSSTKIRVILLHDAFFETRSFMSSPLHEVLRVEQI